MNVDKVFQSLVDLAKEKGGNAVVNIRMEVSSSGSGTKTYIFLVAYGEAVNLV